MNYIYYGDRYYHESGTMLGTLYTEFGDRADWETVATCLRKGEAVVIRPARFEEMCLMDNALLRHKEEIAKRSAQTQGVNDG